jgi:nucleoside-diphosphate-sugar epimerase
LREVIEAVTSLQAKAREEGAMELADWEWNRHIRLIDSSTSAMTISKQHLSGEKIKAATGFEPSMTMRDGLERTAAFYAWYFNQNRCTRTTTK